MNDFHEALGKIAAWTHGSDDTIAGSIIQNDQTGKRRGYKVNSRGVVLDILGSPSDNYFLVSKSYRMSNQIASKLTKEDVLEANPNVEIENEQDLRIHRQDTAISIVETIDQEDIKEYAEKVDEQIGILSSNVTELEAPGSNSSAWDGIEVSARLHPYSEGFNNSNYNDILAQVLQDWYDLARLANETFDEIPEEDPSGIEIELDDNSDSRRAFQ